MSDEARDVRAALGSAPIPKERYTSEAFLRREMAHMWPRVWQLAGLTSDLDRPGAYFTYEVGFESILVVRQHDGIRAFHNVCRHRGRRLRESGSGHASTFRCPYHHWEWEMDGSLRAIPERHTFPALPEPECLALRQVAVATWAGLVWINLDRDAEPLAEYLGEITSRLAPYGLEDYTLIDDSSVDLDCNWKVSIDAANEAYHIGAVHPELLGMFEPRSFRCEFFGRHSFSSATFGVGRDEGDGPPNEMLKQMLREAGVDPGTFAGRSYEVRGAIQRALRARRDLDLSALTDDQLTDNHQYYVFPNVTLNVWPLRLLVLRHRPHPTDPGKMTFDQIQFERLPAEAKRPLRPKKAHFRHGEGSLGPVTDQDTFNLLRVQQGLRSSGLEVINLGDDEIRIRHMHRTIDDYLDGDAGRE